MRLTLVLLAIVVFPSVLGTSTDEDINLFGLNEKELEQLYTLWLQKDFSGTEKSFQSFIEWMSEYDDGNDRLAGVEIEDFCPLSCWAKRIDYMTKRSFEEISHHQRTQIKYNTSIPSVDALAKIYIDADGSACKTLSKEIDSIKNLLQKLNEKLFSKGCPSGFDFLSEANACFSVILGPVNWYDASAKCRQMMPGAHLSAITSAKKQQAIEKYLQSELNRKNSNVCIPTKHQHLGKSVWLSGQTTDPRRCGTPFVWKTPNGTNIPFVYNKWISRQPDCYLNNEHCVHIAYGYNFGWNDLACTDPICALCEF